MNQFISDYNQDVPSNPFRFSRQADMGTAIRTEFKSPRSPLARPPVDQSIPMLLGVISFASIVVSAGVLLAEGFYAYAPLAIIGLSAIHFIGVRFGGKMPARPALESDSVSVPTALLALVQISEGRDRELAGHCLRVAANAVAIGREMLLEERQLEELWWAGLLHDVGKIGVSETILNKPGKLTASELVEVRRHPAYGADIAAPFCGDNQAITDAIRFHHERWDGLGYPTGLSGTQIPIFARILAVADVFEALTSDRPYRLALTIHQAAHYIDREAGCHFDPSVVRAFMRLYKADKVEIADSSESFKLLARGLDTNSIART